MVSVNTSEKSRYSCNDSVARMDDGIIWRDSCKEYITYGRSGVFNMELLDAVRIVPLWGICSTFFTQKKSPTGDYLLTAPTAKALGLVVRLFFVRILKGVYVINDSQINRCCLFLKI